MGLPLSDIANQNFQPGSNFLKSVANTSRKAFCTYQRGANFIADRIEVIPEPLVAMQRAFLEAVCEMPEDPVSLPPLNRSPENQGSCVCQLYRVTYTYQEGDSPPVTETTRAFGPITTGERTIGRPPNLQKELFFTCRGLAASVPCQPTSQFVSIRSQSTAIDLRLVSFTSTPITPDGAIAPDCVRPTLPLPPSSLPFGTPPSIVVPNPNGTSITIPVVSVPIVISPNVKFEPKFILDVGGVNIEFNAGGVEFSVTPTLNAPITINLPNPNLPTLPPSVKPVSPGGGGVDCCDELLARFDDVDEQLEDIQDCVCPKEQELIESFENVQSFTLESSGRTIRRVILIVESSLSGKVFSAPGGEAVSISGWYAFMDVRNKGQRKTIQYQRTVAISDIPDADGFTASVYNGLRMSGFIFGDKEE